MVQHQGRHDPQLHRMCLLARAHCDQLYERQRLLWSRMYTERPHYLSRIRPPVSRLLYVTGLVLLESDTVIRFLAIPIAYVSVRHFYHYKHNGVHPDQGHHLNAGQALPMTQTNSSTLKY